MIYVLTHKQFNEELTSFIPSEVLYLGQGDAPDKSWLDSNDGDSISEKNPSFSEMTGIYWIWKNALETSGEYVGVEHYRRYFLDEYFEMLHEDRLKDIFKNYDVVVPARFPLVPKETVESQLSRCHSEQISKALIKTINDKYEEYIPHLDRAMNEYSLHAFNMFIMKKEYFEKYCDFIFPILFDIEKMLADENGKAPDNREIGYISERLMTVWLYYEKVRYYELPVLRLT